MKVFIEGIPPKPQLTRAKKHRVARAHACTGHDWRRSERANKKLGAHPTHEPSVYFVLDYPACSLSRLLTIAHFAILYQATRISSGCCSTFRRRKWSSGRDSCPNTRCQLQIGPLEPLLPAGQLDRSLDLRSHSDSSLFAYIPYRRQAGSSPKLPSQIQLFLRQIILSGNRYGAFGPR
jgi:hypothetical protein